MKKNKKLVQIATIVATMAGTVPVQAGSLETMVGHKGLVLDQKIATKLVDGEKADLKLFTRGKISLGYDGGLDSFVLVGLSCDSQLGLGAVGKIHFLPDLGVVPRVGVHYSKSIGDFSAYTIGTVKIGTEPNMEFVVALSYTPELNNGLSLNLGVEGLTVLGERGHNFSAQDIRLGLEKEGFSFGAAARITESGLGENLYVDTNFGGYVKIDF